MKWHTPSVRTDGGRVRRLLRAGWGNAAAGPQRLTPGRGDGCPAGLVGGPRGPLRDLSAQLRRPRSRDSGSSPAGRPARRRRRRRGQPAHRRPRRHRRAGGAPRAPRSGAARSRGRSHGGPSCSASRSDRRGAGTPPWPPASSCWRTLAARSWSPRAATAASSSSPAAAGPRPGSRSPPAWRSRPTACASSARPSWASASLLSGWACRTRSPRWAAYTPSRTRLRSRAVTVPASWLDLGWRWLGWRAELRGIAHARQLLGSGPPR